MQPKIKYNKTFKKEKEKESHWGEGWEQDGPGAGKTLLQTNPQ